MQDGKSIVDNLANFKGKNSWSIIMAKYTVDWWWSTI